MRISAKSYPHPVLGNEDDLEGDFKVDFRYKLGKDEVVINPNFVISNKSIEDLIKKKVALFMVEVECGNTFFRKSFTTFKNEDNFSIPACMLRERVTVCFYVCANKDISGYRPIPCHPDYDGMSFNIESGDILAVGGCSSFVADKSFDPLRPPVSSFMSIRPGTFHEGAVEIDYESDKITIVLSRSDWDNYLKVRSQKLMEGVLHSSVVFPVLVDAIHEVQNGDGSYDGYNWHGRIGATLDARGLRDKEPFLAAQKILDNPVSRSFQGMYSFFESDNDE